MRSRLGAALLASLAAGGGTNLGLTFLGGAVVIGIAAALMSAIISPSPDGLGATGPRGGFAGAGGAGAGAAGFGDGGGSGSGDGGCS